MDKFFDMLEKELGINVRMECDKCGKQLSDDEVNLVFSQDYNKLCDECYFEYLAYLKKHAKKEGS